MSNCAYIATPGNVYKTQQTIVYTVISAEPHKNISQQAHVGYLQQIKIN